VKDDEHVAVASKFFHY